LAAGVVTKKKNTQSFLNFSSILFRLYPDRVECTLAGRFDVSERLNIAGSGCRTLGGEEMIGLDDYHSTLREADYMVFFYQKDSYKFGVSGVFFDAINHEIPIIAMRNESFEYFENQIGKIGWLCDSEAGIIDVAINILENPPIGELQEIRRNYRRFKNQNSIEASASKLQTLLAKDDII
jgi:hypothetical protein